MSISERLDTMRGNIPGCSLVSFGDLTTGLALRTSAGYAHKQDYLEDILQQAALNFAVSDALSAEGGSAGPQGHSVIVATPDEVRIFIRSEKCVSDVICCVCDSAQSVGQVAASAHQLFHDMVGGA